MLPELFIQISSDCMAVFPMATELKDVLYSRSVIKLLPGNWMTKYKNDSRIKTFQADHKGHTASMR
jgi:hypothetical protein